MFREMRRTDKAGSQEDARKVLESATHGILAVDGDEGYPYAVPVSYVYEEGRIFFHCASVGHKLEAIAKNPKVSFCVVTQDNVIQEKFTTLYRSVVAFGQARIIEDETERQRVYGLIIDKYSPEFPAEGADYIRAHAARSLIVEINIEHLTAKGKF